jgi:hypothetical protein
VLPPLLRPPPKNDGDQRHQADVAVADVRELVGDHALQLPLVHQVQQARADTDVRLVGAPAGGEGVGRRIVDDVDRRRLGEAGGDRDRFDHVEEPRVLLPVGRVGTGCAGHDAACREPAEDPVDDSDHPDDDEQ